MITCNVVWGPMRYMSIYNLQFNNHEMLISFSFCSNRSPITKQPDMRWAAPIRRLRPTGRLTKLDPYALYIDTPETEYVQTTDNYAWANALHGSTGTEIDNTILCTVDNCCGSACRKCLPYILFESNENPILLWRAISRSTTSKARMLQKTSDLEFESRTASKRLR